MLPALSNNNEHITMTNQPAQNSATRVVTTHTMLGTWIVGNGMTVTPIEIDPTITIRIEATTDAIMIKIETPTGPAITDTTDPEKPTHAILEDARMRTSDATTITTAAENGAHP